jgi:hypothetical protein
MQRETRREPMTGGLFPTVEKTGATAHFSNPPGGASGGNVTSRPPLEPGRRLLEVCS